MAMMTPRPTAQGTGPALGTAGVGVAMVEVATVVAAAISELLPWKQHDRGALMTEVDLSWLRAHILCMNGFRQGLPFGSYGSTSATRCGAG